MPLTPREQHLCVAQTLLCTSQSAAAHSFPQALCTTHPPVCPQLLHVDSLQGSQGPPLKPAVTSSKGTLPRGSGDKMGSTETSSRREEGKSPLSSSHQQLCVALTDPALARHLQTDRRTRESCARTHWLPDLFCREINSVKSFDPKPFRVFSWVINLANYFDSLTLFITSMDGFSRPLTAYTGFCLPIFVGL